jgi:hypothetical protein
MSLMCWMERLSRECRLGICSAPSAIPVHKTCLAVLYAAVCASARQLRWRSVPSAERTKCCGSSERAPSNDLRRCHRRCSMTWAACPQGSCQVGAWQVQGTAAEEAPRSDHSRRGVAHALVHHVTAWRAGKQAVLDYLARYVSRIMAHFQPWLAVIP